MLEGPKDRAYLYAVILDCSAPYYKEQPGKYLCTFSLIDHTINPVDSVKGAPKFFPATIFAKTATELPQVSKIGTIIRIHRGQTKKHKGGFQINCDVNIKGSWVIFDPIDGFNPVSQHGKNITFTTNDRARLQNIRDFSKKFFSKYDLNSYSLKEAAEKKPKDFDTLCYVANMKQKAMNVKIRLCDDKAVAVVNVPANRGLAFEAQDIVRIRSANFYNDGKFKTLTLNDYSNIIKVPKEFRSAKQLLGKIEEGKKISDPVKKELSRASYSEGSPLILSKILKSHKQSHPTPLKDLTSGEASKGGEKYFRVQANIIEIGPKDPQEWVCLIDKKNGKQ